MNSKMESSGDPEVRGSTEGVQTGRLHGLQLNAPHFFEDPAFIDWLNNPKTVVWSWHQKGSVPGEWSDVCVGVDPGLSGEGTDSDMPEPMWDEILTVVKRHFYPGQCDHHILVWITNVRG